LLTTAKYKKMESIMKHNWEKEMLAAEGTTNPNHVTKIHSEWISTDPETIKARYWEMFPETLDKYHLAELIEKATESRPDLRLPGNLYTITPLQGWTWGHRTRVKNAKELAKSIRRFCGWVEKLPGSHVKKYVSDEVGRDCEYRRDEKGYHYFSEFNKFLHGTGRGAGSPYEPNWWGIFERHPSPGGLVKWRQQAWKAAAQLLKPFGLFPCKGTCKEDFFPVLLASSSRRPRRAGFQWAAATLLLLARGKWSISSDSWCYRFPSYSESRDLLARVAQINAQTIKQRAVIAITLNSGHTHKWIEDHSDGVSAAVTEKPIYQKAGVRFHQYVDEAGGYGVLVRHGNRTYHQGNADVSDLTKEESVKNAKFYCWKVALFAAIDAWRRQDEVSAQKEKEKEELLASCNPQGPCELVVLYADSLRAGNCSAGTMAWIRKTFGVEKYAAPYDLIARHADQYNVKLVLNSI
jgi:hypothetical protein